MAKVTGIGGVFFKSRSDATGLAAWYQAHLGIPLESFGGAILKWPDGGMTVWHVADPDTEWFGPSDSSFMINYRVDDLDEMIALLASAAYPGLRAFRLPGVRSGGPRRSRRLHALRSMTYPTPLWTEKRPAGS